MQRTIDETNYRREKQMNYNLANNKTPQALNKSIENALTKSSIASYNYMDVPKVAAEPVIEYLSKPEIEKKIRELRKQMEKAAKELDFMQAAKYRDEIKNLQEKL